MKKQPKVELSTDEPTIRRRDIVTSRTGAEHRIAGAIQKVEALGDVPELAPALEHLRAAFDIVADFCDKQ